MNSDALSRLERLRESSLAIDASAINRDGALVKLRTVGKGKSRFAALVVFMVKDDL